MTQDYTPTSHAGALAGALLLALTAPDDERATKASQLASDIASMMDDQTQFNAVKDSVEACIAYFTGKPVFTGHQS